MDLREFHLGKEVRQEAMRLLAYQPFIIDDDHCTGVAYSWLYMADPRIADSMRYSRLEMASDDWSRALEATKMLAGTYDSIVAEAARLCPGGSFLDIACNNGYFPVRAVLRGMSECAGMDPVNRSADINLLNRITGKAVKFIRGGYASWRHTIELSYRSKPRGRLQSNMSRIWTSVCGRSVFDRRYDVVTNSGLLCHMGEPLHFLAAISALARKVLIVYSGFLDDDDYLIRFNQPYHFIDGPFPACFNDGTAISIKLFVESMRRLGFSRVYELPAAEGGMPRDWHLDRMPRYGRWGPMVCVRE